ncbi:retrovirus-related Pol polyprotein from transposon TNT 1-94 [Trichonephila clavipes]|nr:retrovirus-related Pol polyprotein from transposon TNT 1-94 [Trichonephila clavipes]
MERRDFRVVKIEAELILEANRLQLMKQDLEKAENAYLSSFIISKKSKTRYLCYGLQLMEIQMARMITKRKVKTIGIASLKTLDVCHAGVPNKTEKIRYACENGNYDGYAQRTKGYRIWLINENKLVETINVRFDENKRGINFRQKVNSNLGYNLNLPDYYDDEDDSDRAKDSLTSRLVSKTSTETPSTSERPDVSSDNHSLIPCTEVKWIRNIGRKVTGSNVYYSIEGEAT